MPLYIISNLINIAARVADVARIVCYGSTTT